MDSRSLSPKTTFDYSKSPYFQSLVAFKKKTPRPAARAPVVKESPILQLTISERKRTEEILASMELRVLKMKRKEEQAALKLSTAKSKADLFTTTRLQFEELEVAKQKKREETMQALMQKRREILSTRLAQTQKMHTAKSELLEGRRKRALELKENRIVAINEMQERQLSMRLEKIRVKEGQNISKTMHAPHNRALSQAEDLQLLEEAAKVRQAKEKVTARQIKTLEESEKALQENVQRMEEEERKERMRISLLKTSRSPSGDVSMRSQKELEAMQDKKRIVDNAEKTGESSKPTENAIRPLKQTKAPKLAESSSGKTIEASLKPAHASLTVGQPQSAVTDKPAATDKPAVVEKPVVAVAEKPAVIEKPAVLEKPAEVEKPVVAVAENPAATDKPAVVEKPVVAVIEKPAVLEKPAVAEKPAEDESKKAIDEPAEPAKIESPRNPSVPSEEANNI